MRAAPAVPPRPPVAVPVTIGAPNGAGRAKGAPGAAAREMPVDGPLLDVYGRVHRDLRLSITDRCNLRCVHCLPEHGVTFLPREQLLSFEEITRVAEAARSLGIESVRITGGEPLVRRGVVELVRQVAAVGFEDLSLTTNGTELARLAPELVAAGLHRVNVSCDSLLPERFAAIRRRGELAPVLAAMDAAEAAGLGPVKVNVVLSAGSNDDEVESFAEFARTTGRTVRFIEFMPLDGDEAWSRELVVPAEEVLARIDARWPLEPVPAPDADAAAPAERYRFVDGKGEIGVIASVTRPFCGTCDRLRLTADGSLRNCLFANEELSVRDLVRRGGTTEEIALMIRRSVWAKLPGHGINDPSFLRPARSMSMIGG